MKKAIKDVILIDDLDDIVVDGGINFNIHGSQQFATVIFERLEDENFCLVTIVQDGKIRQFNSTNKYNPSIRRRSTCVYVYEEGSCDNVIKICTIQHKGNTLLEIHSVDEDEIKSLFPNKNLEVENFTKTKIM